LALLAATALGCASRSNAVDDADASVGALTSMEPESPRARQMLALNQTRFTFPIGDADRLQPGKKAFVGSSKVRSVLQPGIVDRFERKGEWLRPVLKGSSPARVDLALPTTASGSFRLRDLASDVGIEVALNGSVDAPAEVANGYLIYSAAHRSGADVMHRPIAEGNEDMLAFESSPRTAEVSYRLSLGDKVAGLRLVANTLELLDARGTPRLRVARPYLVDHRGKTHEARLSVEGCSVDTSPAAPMGRSLTSPGATACTVRVSWNEADVVYPALLDPTWSTTASMAVARMGQCATLLANGQVLVAGGSTDFAAVLFTTTSELFDPTTTTWTATGSLNAIRTCSDGTGDSSAGTATTLGNGQVLVVGGYQQIANEATAEVYDPVAGTWSFTTGNGSTCTANIVTTALTDQSATLLNNGKVLFAGGLNQNLALGFRPQSSAELYDSACNGFSATGSLNQARYSHAAALLGNGQVLIVGGAAETPGSNTTTYLKSAELYDPTTGLWTTTGSTLMGRLEYPHLISLGTKAVVFGGINFPPYIENTLVETFDTATGLWTSTVNLSTSHQWGQVVQLNSGKILVIAGEVNGTGPALTTNEAFNPATGVVHFAGNLSVPRVAHSATLLNSGKVLVAGGKSNSSNFTPTIYSSSEIYDPLAAGPNGTDCDSNSGCTSGFCVSDVCCNSACNPLNTTTSCSTGTCTIVSCASGFRDCDGNANNGCETAIDVSNCIACGNACPAAPAGHVETCNVSGSTGTCSSATCATGFTDCGGGLCADLNGDTSNCGGCGRVCSGTNVASLSCAGGLCNSTCVTSPIVYGNCTQPTFPTADDGCESQISNMTDSPIAITGYTTATFPFANCGACGTSCTDTSTRASHSTHMCVPTGGGAAACRQFDRAQIVTARCSGALACASSCSTSSSDAPCYQALGGEVMNLAADQGPDSDGDGLYDAWETALANPRSGDVSAPAGVNTAAMNPVGIDLNGDGSIDTANDFVFSSFVSSGDLPDPNHKDAYVRIRSMEQEPGSSAGSCTTDASCQSTPICQYPACKLATHHCAVTATSLTSPGTACSTSTDCQLACATPYCDTRATLVDGTTNPGLNHCSEDPATGHAPDTAAPGAVPACGTATTSVISMVQQAFACSPVTNPDATTGVRLHIDYTPTPTLSHYKVLQVQTCDSCTVTPTGQYFTNVKPQFGSDLATAQYVFRFLTFAHSFCKADSAGNSFSGNSEIFGNDSVVTLGTSMFKYDTTDATKAQTRLTAWAGTTMHEGGHAFDLVHYPGTSSATGLPVPSPNFVSVMNYDYQFGIYTTLATGSPPVYTALPAQADPSIPPHIDYSRTLADTLIENTLTEGNGVKAGGYGTNDLISFACPTVLCNLATGAGCRSFGWANGAIDWNCNGAIDSGTVSVPIDGDGDVVDSLSGWGGIPPLPAAQTANGDEWGTGLAYGFLCQPTFADGAPLPPSRMSQDEVSVEFATTHHLLSGPPLGARIDVRPVCSSNFVTLGNSGLMPVAIFGAANLEVSAIELSSLSLSGAAAVGGATFSDIDGDTITDMLVNFRMSDLQITASSTRVVLSGALGSGQQFFGSDSISFVPYPGPVVTIKNDGTGYAFSLVDQLDHVMVPYSVGDGVVSAVDRCGNNLLPSINSVSSMVNLTADEANDVNLHGPSAHQGPDIGITGSSSFWVRRERDGTGAGNGRVYTATFNVTDNCLGCGGNTRQAWFKIQVPRDASGITAIDTCLCTSGLECPDCVLPSGATCTACDSALYAP
jgi:hypothetical protein